MFIAIVLIILGFIGLLSFHDWIRFGRLTPREIQRNLTRIAKLIVLEEWEGAKKILQPLVQNNLGGIERKLLEIQVLRGTKEFTSALQKCTEALHAHPTELYFRIEEGKTYLEMNQPKAALESFLASKSLLRKEADLLDFAASYLHSGFPENAWEVLTPLLKNSASGLAFQLAGETSLALKEYGRAIEFYESAIKSGWNHRLVLTGLGNAQRLLGNFEQAEKIFRKILERDPADVGATLGLGHCMQDRGQHQKALLIYQTGEAWKKKDPVLLQQAAMCALYAGRYNYAEEYFGELLACQGATVDLFSYYGYALEMQKKWEEAEKNYLKQMELFPADARSYRSLAWLFSVGFSVTLTPEVGVEIARKATQLQPDVISWELLSGCEARVGHFEAAHEIQEYLSKFDQEKTARVRRSHILKLLRKQLPLDTQHLSRSLVA